MKQHKARTGGVPHAGERTRCTFPRTPFLPVMIVLVAAFTSSCKPFNVKPNIEVPRPANESQVESNGVVIRGSVIDDEDWLSDTFDANLVLAGILPVRIELRNAGQAAIELSKARFELRTAAGHNLRSTGPERAFKQALSYYGVSAWSKALYKESRADFASYAIDLKAPLAPGASRQGLLYFLLPDEAPSGSAVTLVVSRLRSSDKKDSGRVELKLN